MFGRCLVAESKVAIGEEIGVFGFETLLFLVGSAASRMVKHERGGGCHLKFQIAANPFTR